LLVARLAVEALEAVADARREIAVAAPGAVPTGLISVAAQRIRSGQAFLKQFVEVKRNDVSESSFVTKLFTIQITCCEQSGPRKPLSQTQPQIFIASQGME
jgi:hypothetical protein